MATSQKELKATYKKQRQRVTKLAARMKEKGYELPDNAIPKVPKRITHGSVRALEKLDADAMYRKATKTISQIDEFTGEITQVTISGTEARRRERSEAALKARRTREAETETVGHRGSRGGNNNSRYFKNPTFGDLEKEKKSKQEIQKAQEETVITGEDTEEETTRKVNSDKQQNGVYDPQTGELIGRRELRQREHSRRGNLGEYDVGLEGDETTVNTDLDDDYLVNSEDIDMNFTLSREGKKGQKHKTTRVYIPEIDEWISMSELKAISNAGLLDDPDADELKDFHNTWKETWKAEHGYFGKGKADNSDIDDMFNELEKASDNTENAEKTTPPTEMTTEDIEKANERKNEDKNATEQPIPKMTKITKNKFQDLIDSADTPGSRILNNMLKSLTNKWGEENVYNTLAELEKVDKRLMEHLEKIIYYAELRGGGTAASPAFTALYKTLASMLGQTEFHTASGNISTTQAMEMANYMEVFEEVDSRYRG